ncbi:MAG: ribonuclease M5 [Negativicutes bacterium]
MIKEVLVVEGKMDVAAVRRAAEADCIITGGFTLSRRTLDDIKEAYRRRGIIILTDPDAAGERIRRFLAQRFPDAKHAFIPREEATANDDIGVEQASPTAIRAALDKVRTPGWEPGEIFSTADMAQARLSGAADAVQRRARLGAMLGVGFANAKTFLRRLNHYGVTREEFSAAVAALNGEEGKACAET